MNEMNIKAKIKQALESGNWAVAQELIEQAEPDLEIINMTDAALSKWMIQRAENLVSLALLQQIQLKYLKAAEYWREAAEALPDGMEEKRAEYLAKHNKALADQKELDKSRTKVQNP